jgi:hypothetical protein
VPDSAFAAPSERLPWLPNTPPAARPKPRRRGGAFVTVAAIAGVAALGAWVIADRAREPVATEASPAATVPLPAPPVEQGNEPVVAPLPGTPSASERDALRPDSPLAAERAASRPERRPERRRAVEKPKAQSAPAAVKAEPSPYDPRAWNSGVPGRIIQLGSYPSSAKAQSEWRRVYQRYPLLRPLSPRVIKAKVRGKIRYRLQLGTFSQAHSELLCQRLRTLGEGCIVLGMPKRGQG